MLVVPVALHLSLLFHVINLRYLSLYTLKVIEYTFKMPSMGRHSIYITLPITFYRT